MCLRAQVTFYFEAQLKYPLLGFPTFLGPLEVGKWMVYFSWKMWDCWQDKKAR